MAIESLNKASSSFSKRLLISRKSLGSSSGGDSKNNRSLIKIDLDDSSKSSQFINHVKIRKGSKNRYDDEDSDNISPAMRFE